MVKNPQTPSGAALGLSKASALTALKLKVVSGTNNISDVVYSADSPISQTIGVGSTAVGYVASWEPTTGVLKVYTPVGIGSTTYGHRLVDFTSGIGPGGTYSITGGSGGVCGIDTSFGSDAQPGTATTVGTAIVQLGQSFIEGVALPEVKKYSGEILYIDNRAAIQRSATQKEDVKVVLEF